MFLARYGSAFRRAKTFEVNRSMRDTFKEIADSLALAVEASAVLIIAYGAIEAIGGSIRAVQTAFENRSAQGGLASFRRLAAARARIRAGCGHHSHGDLSDMD